MARLVLSRPAPCAECDPLGQTDVLSWLISKPREHVFLRLKNPKYNGALAKLGDGQGLSCEKIEVKLVLEGKEIRVKREAIIQGEERSRLVADAILTLVSVHMLHATVGSKLERHKILLDNETTDAVGISLYAFDELVASMADLYVAMFKGLGAGVAVEQKKNMDGLVAYVKAHQEEHGRMLVETFMLYKTIPEEDRAKVNKNALTFHPAKEDKKAQFETAVQGFAKRFGQ